MFTTSAGATRSGWERARATAQQNVNSCKANSNSKPSACRMAERRRWEKNKLFTHIIQRKRQRLVEWNWQSTHTSLVQSRGAIKPSDYTRQYTHTQLTNCTRWSWRRVWRNSEMSNANNRSQDLMNHWNWNKNGKREQKARVAIHAARRR